MSASSDNETRAQYKLVTRNSDAGMAVGLYCGDVLVVYESGSSAIMRPAVNGPPIGHRARVEAEPGTLIPLEPREQLGREATPAK